MSMNREVGRCSFDLIRSILKSPVIMHFFVLLWKEVSMSSSSVLKSSILLFGGLYMAIMMGLSRVGLEITSIAKHSMESLSLEISGRCL